MGCAELGTVNEPLIPRAPETLEEHIFPTSTWVLDMNVEGVSPRFRDLLKGTTTYIKILEAHKPVYGYSLAKVYNNSTNQLLGQKALEIFRTSDDSMVTLLPLNGEGEEFMILLNRNDELEFYFTKKNSTEHILVGILRKAKWPE
jgi:hypothetical protein